MVGGIPPFPLPDIRKKYKFISDQSTTCDIMGEWVAVEEVYGSWEKRGG